MRKNKTNPKSQKSVENGILVLQTAIDNNLSLSEASRKHKFGRNYVSDIKSRISTNFEKKNINREVYRTFNSLVKKYEKNLV